MKTFKTKRGLFKFAFFSLITCGIYALYYFHRVSVEFNAALAEDGKKTAGLVKFFFLSMITFGIYGLVWWIKVTGRIKGFYERKGIPARLTTGKFILWMTLGCLILVGPLVAMGKFIKSHNEINADYNARIQAAAAPVEEKAEEVAEEKAE